VLEGIYPARWTDRQVVITLPEHVDVSNAARIREQLLALINAGAATIIADMSATLSCDQAGSDAIARAYQRALVSGAQLRLVVTSPLVRRVLDVDGLDRLVSMYPSLEAAAAARPVAPWPDRGDAGPAAAPRRRGRTEPPGSVSLTPAVLRHLVDALGDGVALVDDSGVMTLANVRLGEMFGYASGELAGRPIEDLVPEPLRPAHQGHRSDYAAAPSPRPMGNRSRLVGLRKDGTTFPVAVSLSPVPTATSNLTLAIVRDATTTVPHPGLADLITQSVSPNREQRSQELLDRVASHIFEVGICLQAAVELPSDVARQHIERAIVRLDQTIDEIRGHVFAAED
jgi:anti-anti-sigma factor